MLNKDWIVEQVKIVPIDAGEKKHRNKYKSYIVYRQNSFENLTSFILDLKLNKNFNSHIPIEYDNNRIRTKRNNCLFYTGSVRHWGESQSMVAISHCSGLVSFVILLLFSICFLSKLVGWSNSRYSTWYRLFFRTSY